MWNFLCEQKVPRRRQGAPARAKEKLRRSRQNNRRPQGERRASTKSTRTPIARRAKKALTRKGVEGGHCPPPPCFFIILATSTHKGRIMYSRSTQSKSPPWGWEMAVHCGGAPPSRLCFERKNSCPSKNYRNIPPTLEDRSLQTQPRRDAPSILNPHR